MLSFFKIQSYLFASLQNNNIIFQASFASNPSILGDGAILVAGGSGPGNNTIEYLTSTGWKVSPTKLPASSYQGCAAPINSTHYIILEGKNGNIESNRVFFYNIISGALTQGPSRTFARSGFSCTTGNFGANTTAVVIAGGGNGINYVNTVEYLDLSIGYWITTAGKWNLIFCFIIN